MAWPPKLRWTLVRLSWGMAQILGAAFSLGLLITTGVTAASLLAVVLTGVCTTLSVLLFGARTPAVWGERPCDPHLWPNHGVISSSGSLIAQTPKVLHQTQP